VDLLCIAPELPGRNTAGRAGRERYRQRILGEANQILSRAAKKLSARAGVVKVKAAIGSPSLMIVEKTADYDLAVVGAKGRGTTQNVGLGPVASRVLEHSTVPVLIGRRLRGEDVSAKVAWDAPCSVLVVRGAE
jgi:nucleotide-binding universal stress UspA family protein